MESDSPFNATPNILKQCLDLFSSPTQSFSIPVEINVKEKYNDHPDIQYFRKIKAENHYAYHKFKTTPKKPAPKDKYNDTEFDPFSRTQLLDRLSSFSSLNWSVPFDNLNQLNELTCARNGWKCISISINHNSKNHLLCTSCKRLATLRFNDYPTDSDFDVNEYQELNEYLAQEYLTQIKTSAHDKNCPWRSFETPDKGTYYLKPYIESTNEPLFNSYLHCLKGLTENCNVLCERLELFTHLQPESEEMQKLKLLSNNWLLSRYYNDNKENKFSSLNKTPQWIYIVALLGWNLKVQSFAQQLVLFLVCPDCNRKLFLDSTEQTASFPKMSSSDILTPVKYPMAIRSQTLKSHYDVNPGDEEDETLNLFSEHKSWCLRNLIWNDTTRIEDYLFKLLLSLESGVGPNGEYLGTNESSMFVDDESLKTKVDFNIDEGLERLNKLRKLYLVDD